MAIFNLICYQDSCNINEALEKLIKAHSVSDYAYILHDKDINDNGEYKKPHYHVVLKIEFKDPNHSKKEQLEISNLFGLVGGQCGQIARSEKNSLLYLTHSNDKDKYQYDNTEIVYYSDYLSSVYSRALNEKERVQENSFETLFNSVLEWIESVNKPLSWRDVLTYLRKQKILTKCVAFMGILRDYLRWHNQDYFKTQEWFDKLQDLEEIKKGNYREIETLMPDGSVKIGYEIL